MTKILFYFISIIAFFLTSCGKSKSENAEEAAIQLDSLKNVETMNSRILGVARIEPENGILNILAGTTGRISAVLIKENDD